MKLNCLSNNSSFSMHVTHDMTDEDALRVFDYRRSLEPVTRQNKEHDICVALVVVWIESGL